MYSKLPNRVPYSFYLEELVVRANPLDDTRYCGRNRSDRDVRPAASRNISRAFFLDSARPDCHLVTQVIQMPGPTH